MSLKWYRRPRLVALNPDAPVLDAARALESNEIGAVIVQQKGRAVGIVTDRDLAVRVIGRGLNPQTTRLSEVMTTPVWTLSAGESQAEAVRVMRERNIRRVPLLEGGRIAGLVTLDDLLLDEAAPLDELAAVIEAQIGEGGPAPSSRRPGEGRRKGRAESTYGRLLNRLRAEADLNNVAEAEILLDTVLEPILKRLTPDEAKDTIAQLPSLMQDDLYRLPLGPDKQITRRTIEEEINRKLAGSYTRASQLLRITVGVLSQIISPGQMEDIRGQLPPDLRSLFEEPQASTA